MPALLIRDLAQVVSPAPGSGPLRGSALGDIHVVEDGYVLCEAGKIASVGAMRELDRSELPAEIVDLDGSGKAAVPGLVDCHTHACFAGDRAAEFELRARGASYEELHAAGGGILATVRATREAGEQGLERLLERHRGWMLAHGTTTFEAKSGYGLDKETELAQLRAIAGAGGVPTFLGAHAIPPEFPDGDAYLDFVLAEVLPEAATLAEAADVFVERGAFDVRQAARYLTACREAGLALRLHADQFTEAGGIELALELGARSVDHLEATGPNGVQALAASDVCRRPPPGRRSHPRPADAACPCAGRRRRDRRSRYRLQPRQCVLRQPSDRDQPCVHSARARSSRGAHRLYRERRARARTCRSTWVGSMPATSRIWCSSTPPTGGTSPTIWGESTSRS